MRKQLIDLRNYYNYEALKNDKEINFGRSYQQCDMSVMDTIADPNIFFNGQGICNYYYEYKNAEKEYVFRDILGEKKISYITDKIKKSRQGKKYDCITGISGGVDSTYLVLLAKRYGLNPLIVHFDNGWNSELSVKNIENIIQKTGYDLYTLVVDWEEFKDIQLAYLKASVVDIEAITDHAIIGTLFKLADKYDIKYILSGNNIVTEHVLPSYWVFNKADDINIKDIHEKHGTRKLKTFPFFTYKERRLFTSIKRIEIISLLNYVNYNKEEVKKEIAEKMGWRDYGGKHYESVFTRFYQGFILPYKFNIDKRKAHLSNLIFSGQMLKSEALKELTKPIYEITQLENDFDYVLKKFNMNAAQFMELMNLPRKEHKEYNYIHPFFNKYYFLRFLRPLWNKIK